MDTSKNTNICPSGLPIQKCPEGISLSTDLKDYLKTIPDGAVNPTDADEASVPLRGFSSSVTTSCEFNKFNESDYFREYHFYEKYDSSKIYPQGKFEYDYGHGKHSYEHKLYTIFLYTDIKKLKKEDKREYVIAEERVSEEELKELSKYCQCAICTASWFNITRHFMCPCCVGCLKIGEPSFAHQYGINKARKYKQKFDL